MEKSPYANLRRVILISMILVPLITFILILEIGYYYFTTSLESSTIATIKRIVEDRRHTIDSPARTPFVSLCCILLNYFKLSNYMQILGFLFLAYWLQLILCKEKDGGGIWLNA